MSPDAHDRSTTTSSAITWFAADRPVEGGTVFVTPATDERPNEDDDSTRPPR